MPRRMILLLALLAVLIVVSLGSMLAGRFYYRSDKTTAESPSGKIAIDLGYEIRTMKPNGSNLTPPLTDGTTPAWSPDGKKIAFMRGTLIEEEGCARCGFSGTVVPHIYVMNADGSDEAKIVNMPAEQPTWSPDGKEIAFSAREHYDGDYEYLSEASHIYVMNADGSGAPRHLTDGTTPAWSPDGTKIAFSRASQGNSHIYVMSASGGDATDQAQQLTFGSGRSVRPVWSPDGTEIAFTHLDSPYGESYMDSPTVYKIDANGSGRTRLTYGRATDYWPTWSPDGDHIGFVRSGYIEMTESPALFMIMNSDGSDPTVVRTFKGETEPSFLDWRGGASQDENTEHTIEDGHSTKETIEDWRALDASLRDTRVQAYIEQVKQSQDKDTVPVDITVPEGLEPSEKQEIVRFLIEADLLQSVNLYSADLSYVNLSGADLSGTDLSYADLESTNLKDADLSGAQLHNANLRGANLSGANLKRASLYQAYMPGAYLQGAYLQGANLEGADLHGANLAEAKGITVQELESQVQLLEGATMPDGSTHP